MFFQKNPIEELESIINNDDLVAFKVYLGKTPNIDINKIYTCVRNSNYVETCGGSHEHNTWETHKITFLHEAIEKNACKIVSELILRGADTTIDASITYVDETIDYPDFNSYSGGLSLGDEERNRSEHKEIKSCLELCQSSDMKAILFPNHNLSNRQQTLTA